MVKFSGIPCAILWIVIVPVLSSIANYTEAKYQRGEYSTPAEYHSSSAEESRSSPKITSRKKSATDVSSALKFQVQFRNDTNVQELKSSDGESNSPSRIPPPRLSKVRKILNGTNNYYGAINSSAVREQEKRKRDAVYDLGDRDSSFVDGNNSFTKTIAKLKSMPFRGTANRSDPVNVATTTGSLTLMNFTGPVISQDPESSKDEGLRNSEHIRVKRRFQDSDESHKIREAKISNRYKDDDKSNVKNELDDIYPDSVDDHLNSSTEAVELIRKKRFNYEMLLPAKSEYETRSVNPAPEVHDDMQQEQSKESTNDDRYSLDRKNSDLRPVFLESFSKYENSLLQKPVELANGMSERQVGLKEPDLKRDADSRSVEADEIGNNFSKSRKKRYAQVERRTRSKGGNRRKGHGKKPKSKHGKKHKQKQKKSKKPATKTDEERSLAAVDGDPNFQYERGSSRLVDELQVEAHVQKRETEDAGSEIHMNKGEISNNYNGNDEIQLSRDKRTVEIDKNLSTREKSDEDYQPAECRNEKSRYHNDVHEPADLRTRRDYTETRSYPDLTIENEEAVKSVREIKDLIGKMIANVNELEAYVNTRENEDLKRGKKEIEFKGDSLNSENSNRDRRTVGIDEILPTKEKSNYDYHSAECKNGELRYHNDVHEPDLRTQRDSTEPKSEFVRAIGNRKAVRSVRQIKKLIEKIIENVNELEMYVNIREYKGGTGGSEFEGDFSNSTNSNRDKRNEDRKAARTVKRIKKLIEKLIESVIEVEMYVNIREHGNSQMGKRETEFKEGSSNSENSNRDRRTVEIHKNLSTRDKSNGDYHPPECKNEELRYYNDVHEPDVRTQRDSTEKKSDFVRTIENSEAVKSVKEIKQLIGRIIDNVNKLETYVNTRENRDLQTDKRKREFEEDSLNPTNLNVGKAGLKNLMKIGSESRICADETDALKSKSDFETRALRSEKNEAKEKERTAEMQPEEKRSTGILKRRETSRTSNTRKRKAHRKWDAWTDWSSCSVTCSKGRQIRWRHCIHDCISAETEMEEKTCQLPACGPGKFLGIF